MNQRQLKKIRKMMKESFGMDWRVFKMHYRRAKKAVYEARRNGGEK